MARTRASGGNDKKPEGSIDGGVKQRTSTNHRKFKECADKSLSALGDIETSSDQHYTSEVTAFLDKFAKTILTRNAKSYKWKPEMVSAALEKAVTALPSGPLKEQLERDIQGCAGLLRQNLLLGYQADGRMNAKTGSAKPHSSRSRPQPGIQAAKKPRTGTGSAPRGAPQRTAPAEHPGAGTPSSLLFDHVFLEKCQDTHAAAPHGQPPPDHIPQVCTARCPPPRGLVSHVLGLGAVPPQDFLESLQRGRSALGVCASLAALAPSAAAGLACFADVADWLFQAGSVLQSQVMQDVQHATQLWGELEGAAARLLTCLMLTLRQYTHHAQQQPGSWLLSAPAGLGDAGQTACETCSRAVALRAMCKYNSARLSASKAGLFAGCAIVAHAAQDLCQLAPFAAQGQLALMVNTPQDSINASTDAAASFVWMFKALLRQELMDPEASLVRIAVARKAAEACRAGGLEREGTCVLAEAVQASVSPQVVSALRMLPPSAVVQGALVAAGAGGQHALSRYLVKEVPEKVLVAMAQKVAEIMAEGAEGVNALSIEEQAQGSAERAPNIEASAVSAGDDLLFFVSTDADTTMFGRDWNAEGSGLEGSDDNSGVHLDELSGTDDEGEDIG